MKYIFQFCIILCVTLAGEVLHALIPLPVPAGIYGLIIMFVCLKTGLIHLEKIKETANFLLGILPVVFVPMSSGLMNIYNSIGTAIIYIAIISIVSTVVVMVATGHAAQFMIRHSGGRRHE